MSKSLIIDNYLTGIRIRPQGETAADGVQTFKQLFGWCHVASGVKCSGLFHIRLDLHKDLRLSHPNPHRSP